MKVLRGNEKIKLEVSLNGTAVNPFHAMGLMQNPFSQLGIAELDAQVLHLQKLGGDPIPNTDYIREHLKGWSPEFVELCVSQFKPGEMVKFTVEFPR